ncbi:hypothetical protein [Natrinema gelatinilyticum]|uniref:hypothetical protein n=1 Tax=Natrinema gelatinilyticum TaxID=2961571 RepID=UPI0020C48316|nr:hypothetical protein [Natrinema gelatinilyticum]
MPYLEPEHVLHQFASYLNDDVRSAIADDQKFVQAQVGSMSSSLNFLAMELGGMHVAMKTQRRRLLCAFDDIESELGDGDAAVAVADAIDTARAELEQTDMTDVRALETELTNAANTVFEAINTELDEKAARRARRPLYDFLDTRVQTQLDLLGRE